MDWDDLKVFLAVAEEGSLAAAGRRLHVDHVTVARRIAVLESRTAVKLVDRRQGKTVLTPAGERIAEHARRMQMEIFSLERTLKSEQQVLSADVSISLPPAVSVHFIAPHLAAFYKDYPDVRLQFIGENRVASLVRREADIALGLTQPKDNALIARKVGVFRYRIYGAASLVGQRPITEMPILLFDETLNYVAQQTWFLSVVGNRTPVLRTNYMNMLAAAAMSGIGLAVLPEFLAKAYQLTEADPQQRFFDRDVWMTWHEDLRGHPAITAVTAFLARCLSPA